MNETITSPHNPKLKELRKLHERKHRDRSGLFFAEGEDMLTEALRHGALPRAVFYDAASETLVAGLPESVDLIPATGEALAKAGSLGSGSRLIGVWDQRWSGLDAIAGREVAVYLHEVGDPGNVGTVVRSALALASAAVVLSPESADPFGPKAIRASMGAIFAQPVVRCSFEEAQAALPGHRALALVPEGGRPLPEIDLEPPLLLCLGSERAGLPERIASACDEAAHIPLRPDGTGSLNVAMTATISLYESSVLAHRLSSPDG